MYRKVIEQDLEGILVEIPSSTHVKGKVNAKTGVTIGYNCIIEGPVKSEGWVRGDYSCEYRKGISAGSWIKLGYVSKVRGGLESGPRDYIIIGYSSDVEGPIQTTDLRLEHSTKINGREVNVDEAPRRGQKPYQGGLSAGDVAAWWWFSG